MCNVTARKYIAGDAAPLACRQWFAPNVLIHYGRYETTFLRRMSERHGKPPECSSVAATIEAAVNLLSVIFAQVYYPCHSNGLKEIAKHHKGRSAQSLAGQSDKRNSWKPRKTSRFSADTIIAIIAMTEVALHAKR